MPLAHHRDPGVLGAAYTHSELKVQLIADGVHVHPLIIRFLVQVKGPGGVLLISDAMPAAGLPDGMYDFAGHHVTVRQGKAYLEDGTLAGSTATLDEAIRVIVTQTDIPLQQAARMAGLNAARVLKVDDRKGVIAAGYDADLVVLDNNLEVEMTILGGKIVHSSSD